MIRRRCRGGLVNFVELLSSLSRWRCASLSLWDDYKCFCCLSRDGNLICSRKPPPTPQFRGPIAFIKRNPYRPITDRCDFRRRLNSMSAKLYRSIIPPMRMIIPSPLPYTQEPWRLDFSPHTHRKSCGNPHGIRRGISIPAAALLTLLSLPPNVFQVHLDIIEAYVITRYSIFRRPELGQN